ncbi:toll/interleukin-1 receptor domain-containing protein [Massilia rubra]|uniref:SEFIR domain-containing protein n=1 Tax=Massilia rubra TaxID=2607910 RepID=A0ABX0LRM9_9BURK|nr:toll/interleukin-1 receptor domain-containing protein [Massilia rubra]NHZ34114.1 hypothetical protein [Massilia rubra]
MSASTEHPKVFISYSWTTPEHEQFVIDFATTLRGHGIDAVLDKWDLKPGHDKYVFMESMVVDPSVNKVLVICDRKYQEKANSRAGGVGTESQIISQELYGRVKQTKFVPVVCEYDDDGHPCLPVFMKGLIYIDVSNDEQYGAGLDELLRLIYEQPFHQKPKLGGVPYFVSSSGASYVKELGAALRAIQDGKPNRHGLEALFIKSLLSEVTKLYVTPEGDDYDEGVFQAISSTKSLRDQLAEYVEGVAAFSGDDTSSLAPFLKLMEGLGAHFGPPTNQGSFYPGWADLYYFFAYEAFLIQAAALLRHSCWKCLRRLMSAVYVIQSSRQSATAAETFVAFDKEMVSLDEHRNRRLTLKRVSVVADILKERCSTDKASFPEIMEADVFLMLGSVASSFPPTPAGEWPRIWRARTTIYSSYGNKFKMFLRAADEDTRTGIRTAIGVTSGRDLQARLETATTRFPELGRNGGFHDNFNFLEAINFNELVK